VADKSQAFSTTFTVAARVLASGLHDAVRFSAVFRAEPMPRKSNLSIRAAVMNCLARCSESEAPLCCLGEFLEKLASMGWDAEDIFGVERSVLHLLGRVRENALETSDSPEDELSSARMTGRLSA
jgi:hypothetical protein